MTEDPDNIVLRYLRRIDDKVDRLDRRIDDLTSDMRSLKTHMAGFMQNEIAQDSTMAALQARVDRLERRLDLSEDTP